MPVQPISIDQLRSWSVLVASFALLWSANATAQTFNPVVHTLDNGLELVVIENHRAPIAVQMVYYKVGGADEEPGKSGLAHFLEHLMFKGTKTRAPGEYSEIIAENGGRENAFTTQDYTGYWQKVAVDRLPMMMELESDRMANLVLHDENVLPERLVILEERRSRVDNKPAGVLGEQVLGATWANHPYRIPIIGWAHEIEQLTTQDAIDFYNKWYAPNNAVVVIAGDVDAQAVIALAEQTYGQLPRRDVATRNRPTEPEHRAARRVEMRDPSAQQPAWNRRYIAPSYIAGETENAYALEVLSQLFGGGSTSRLYRAMVVDGKAAAGAGAWYSPDTFDLTTFGVWFSPRPDGSVDDGEAAMEAAIGVLLDEGVAEVEVERAKQRLVDAAIYALDSTQTMARIFGVALATGQTAADVEEWPERIRAVTVEDVNRAARAVFRPEAATTGVLLPAAAD